MPQNPAISILVPLYKAAPFVDNLVADLKALPFSRLEVVFADQHRLDDAVERLAEAFREDPRVRIIATNNELRWWENYEFLLNEARGDWVMILSQDDRLPSRSLEAAVEALADHPNAIAVYGPADMIDPEGKVVVCNPRRTWPRRLSGARWAAASALGHIAGVTHPMAKLGLFRIDVARSQTPAIPETEGHTGLSTTLWVFEMMLCGPILFCPGFIVQYRVHPDSITSLINSRTPRWQWRRSVNFFAESRSIWQRRFQDRPFAQRFGVPLLGIAIFGILLPLRIIQRGGRKERISVRLRISSHKPDEPDLPAEMPPPRNEQ